MAVIDLSDELDGYGDDEQPDPDQRHWPRNDPIPLRDLQAQGFNREPPPGDVNIGFDSGGNWRALIAENVRCVQCQRYMPGITKPTRCTDCTPNNGLG